MAEQFPVSFRLPMDMKLRLEAAAAADGRSVGGLIRKLVADHLARLDADQARLDADQGGKS